TSQPLIHVEDEYLPNVVQMELGPKHFGTGPQALRAQAIAARSYALHWFENRQNAVIPEPLTNSNQHQVYVPYAFDALNPKKNVPNIATARCSRPTSEQNAFQQAICAAVAPRYYLSYSTGDLPAFAEFFSDVPLQTVTSPEKPDYLLSVPDPISTTDCAITLGHARGMSQLGAIRWERGKISTKVEPCMRDWSVQWTRAEQILFHYYTHLHLRDAGASGYPILSAPKRFNVLDVSGLPAQWVWNGTYQAQIQVQNTGIYNWMRCKVELVIEAVKDGVVVGRFYRTVDCANEVSPGQVRTVTFTFSPLELPAGIYTFSFDMLETTQAGQDYWASLFSHQQPIAWGKVSGTQSYQCDTCKGEVNAVQLSEKGIKSGGWDWQFIAM
ncbi:MAG TPA: SpoIID/LytB domain-containing protein, partial [Anaerolineales bacterium]|nr:SpoIID/LytB domain-containing protein [Anaerolineales bacterium]